MKGPYRYPISLIIVDAVQNQWWKGVCFSFQGLEPHFWKIYEAIKQPKRWFLQTGTESYLYGLSSEYKS